MRSVNVAKRKDRLSEYLGGAKNREEVILRDRNLPVAKLVPFEAEGASEQDLLRVAAGNCDCRRQSFTRKCWEGFRRGDSRGTRPSRHC
jgi:antitoxin (DNA-binding transcriptional repressor) of toxin-antitoxin stability system